MSGLQVSETSSASFLEHAPKPAAVQAHVARRYDWSHAFGHMVIETCVDGSVWIDGKPVPETLPLGQGERSSG